MPIKAPTFHAVAEAIIEAARTRVDLGELAIEMDDPLDDEDFWDVVLNVCSDFVWPFIKSETLTIGDLANYGASNDTIFSAVLMYIVDNVGDAVRQLVLQNAYR